MKTTNAATPQVCDNGHQYYKSSDCSSCPVCDRLNKSASVFLSSFAAPVRRALVQKGITNARLLSNYTEKEILSLHGIGKSSLPRFKRALAEENLDFRES